MCEIKSRYVYLLQEREFTKTHESIFKIGKTTQPNITRFAQYPKGSILLLQIICVDCTKCEKMIMKKFKEKYIQRLDIGLEYFEGNCKKMIPDICNIVSLLDEEVEQEILEINNLKHDIFENVDIYTLENYETSDVKNLTFLDITNVTITNKTPLDGFIEYSNGYYIQLGIGDDNENIEDRRHQLMVNIMLAYYSKRPIIYKIIKPKFELVISHEDIRKLYYTYQHHIARNFINSTQYDALDPTDQLQYTCFKNCNHIKCNLYFLFDDIIKSILQGPVYPLKTPQGILMPKHCMVLS